MPHAHQHAGLEANLLLSGSLTFLFNGRFIQLPVGRLVLFSALCPHAVVRCSQDAEFIVFSPSGSRFDCPPELLTHLLDGALLFSSETASEAGDDTLVRRWFSILGNRTPHAEEIIALEMHARILRFSGNLRRDQPLQPPPTAPVDRHLRAMLEFIHANFREPIRNADIAAAANLHPRYAVRLFRERTRFGLNAYVTRTRLAEAERSLLRSDASVTEIAFACGFQSLSRFYDAFQARHRITPARYRRRVRSDG